ncbi:hypothetical protein F511_18700 [Dorcoceras hygrometricum]|uniref:Uncharacterized protein n=1 Tax=Dorcoceras hygrometricum TaxID=472368 RepID=A0A2Z7C2P5_9LAMI|nr:hypothetical protein F511_18700 [Dorcoceras hygrometricum]
MFKSLEDTGLKGFLEASSSVYEDVVGELFTNVKVVAGTIISFIANGKLALMKYVLSDAFGLPTEGMTSFLDIPSKTVAKMRMKFSVAKELCEKAGSFDVVTSKKFDLMVTISADLKVNWAQVLFQTLVVMVNTPTKQSQGFVVQVSVLLQNLVKTDLGEVVKLHPQKVLNSKSFQTYMKKNLKVGKLVRPAGFRVLEQVRNTPLLIVLSLSLGNQRRRLVR